MTDNTPNGIFIEGEFSGISVCYGLPNDRMHYAYYDDKGGCETIPLGSSNILSERQANSLWDEGRSYLLIPEELL